jgi:predicted DNA-binding protein
MSDIRMDTISIKIPHSMNQILENIAEKEDRSKSSLVRKMINDIIEDYYDVLDADEALKAFENDGRQTISAAEVFAKCGIEWSNK